MFLKNYDFGTFWEHFILDFTIFSNFGINVQALIFLSEQNVLGIPFFITQRFAKNINLFNSSVKVKILKEHTSMSVFNSFGDLRNTNVHTQIHSIGYGHSNAGGTQNLFVSFLQFYDVKLFLVHSWFQ